MTNDQIRAGIAQYEAEINNIRYFLRAKKTMFEWQDWLWRRVPKFKATTERLRASTMRLGGGWDDIACRYTELLTCLCMVGDVERVRTKHSVEYRWVGVDKQ